MNFTCISCCVSFSALEDQRQHYKTEWHRYNLKRKVAEMPALSLEEFSTRRLEQMTLPIVNNHHDSSHCSTCNKSFASKSTLENHLVSKKHKDRVKFHQDESVSAMSEESTPKDPKLTERYWINRFATARSEEEIEQIMKEKIESSVNLSVNDCLFCPCTSQSVEENLDHMTRAHSFFIPELEYLVDVGGLLEYLGSKVSVHNICLFCNEKSRNFYSIEAVRRHMNDKGHCRLRDIHDGDEELGEFYDFSSTWDDTTDAALSEDKGELILPSGARVGHRDYQVYYKQRLRQDEQRDSILIHQLMGQYRALGWVQKENVSLAIDRKRCFTQSDSSMRLGVKANRLQHHFREQIL